jgi:hypothetical protein
MRRGDILTVAAPGDCGKPRLAVLIQSEQLYRLLAVVIGLA